MIAIIDYGMGNIHSVKKALETFGAQVVVANDPQSLLKADKAILPGVGAFDDAILTMNKSGMVKAMLDFIKSGKPFLGICLGMQILFEKSQEAKKTKGLNVIKGKVLKFPDKKGYKVPQMGWNQLNIKNTDCPLLKNISDGSYVYFCHSYYPAPQQRNVKAATTNYAAKFASVVWKDNIYGVQFHPEKSQSTGLRMIENFINLC
ncbi:MAG: imidazole glycerol phosphate synthase subunit HisH [Candidatus Omnitrophica bacterium]|nr:imidazole glycerol phosphate synthase subunit HisH [Candidatus Omnitrophota bacterium]